MKLQNTGQSQTSHSKNAYHDIMDDIDDPSLFLAVKKAREYMRNGMNPGLANWTAAVEHYVDVGDVAHWCGKLGGRVKRGRENLGGKR